MFSFPSRKILAFIIPAILAGAFLGCTLFAGGAAVEKIAFTGTQTGCGNFLVAKESADGRWNLVISDETAFTGDTLYEESLGDTANASVKMERFDRTHLLYEYYCNDVSVETTLLETRKATAGLLRVKVYNVVLDTLRSPDDSSLPPMIWRNYRMNVELHDVKFEGGTEAKELYIDSVHAGWLPG